NEIVSLPYEPTKEKMLALVILESEIFILNFNLCILLQIILLRSFLEYDSAISVDLAAVWTLFYLQKHSFFYQFYSRPFLRLGSFGHKIYALYTTLIYLHTMFWYIHVSLTNQGLKGLKHFKTFPYISGELKLTGVFSEHIDKSHQVFRRMGQPIDYTIFNIIVFTDTNHINMYLSDSAYQRLDHHPQHHLWGHIQLKLHQLISHVDGHNKEKSILH
ncbi:hypothetical protein ACJX0J_029532, partial [Zea mays]